MERAAVALLACVVLGGCGLSETEIDRMINDRLIAEALIEPPPPPAGVEPGPEPAVAPDPLSESQAFLDTIAALMQGYEPGLPEIDDPSEVLRCLTTEAIEADSMLSKAVTGLKRTQQHAEDARTKAAETALNRLPLEYRLDLGWQDRVEMTEAKYGCLQWQVEVSISGYGRNKRTCAKRGLISASKPVSPEAPLYPNGPPELMKRLESAAISVPDRFHCRVASVEPEAAYRAVGCADAVQLHLFGEGSSSPSGVNKGDVVSVPLAGVRHDPHGVLWRSFGDQGGWVVDVDAKTLVVEDRAVCPTTSEVLLAAGVSE